MYTKSQESIDPGSVVTLDPSVVSTTVVDPKIVVLDPNVQKILDMDEDENNQHFFKEIHFSPVELDNLSIKLTSQTEEDLEYIEYFNDMKGRLLARVFELVEMYLTEHQKKILLLLLKNKTYNSIASLLSINYTAVAHAIKGIKTKKHEKYHGGIERKLQKICLKDEECLSLIESIKQARQNIPMKESIDFFC